MHNVFTRCWGSVLTWTWDLSWAQTRDSDTHMKQLKMKIYCRDVKVNVWRVDTGLMGVIGRQKWPCGGLEGKPACARWGKQHNEQMCTCGTGRPTLRQDRRILTRLRIDHSVSTALGEDRSEGTRWSPTQRQAKRDDKRETIKIHKGGLNSRKTPRIKYFYFIMSN